MRDALLIVSVVRKGWGSTVMDASVRAGARGGTVMNGRGAGIHEQEKIFGMSIEPEKEIVLTIAYRDQVDRIDFDGGPDTARDVVLQRNGKIVVVGEATDRGTRRLGVARIRGS